VERQSSSSLISMRDIVLLIKIFYHIAMQFFLGCVLVFVYVEIRM